VEAESVDRTSPLRVASTRAALYAAIVHPARQREAKEKSKFSRFDRTGRCPSTKGLAEKAVLVEAGARACHFSQSVSKFGRV
jgi:hypothetical protein